MLVVERTSGDIQGMPLIIKAKAENGAVAIDEECD